MNWKTSGADVAAFLRRAGIPVLAAALLVSIPVVRAWLWLQLQAHPLLGALVLAAVAFVTAYLIAGQRTPLTKLLLKQFRDAGLILLIVLFLVGFGFVLTGASSTLAATATQSSALRTSMLWAAACFMTGFLAGFLFGVPKIAADSPSAASSAGGSQPGGFAQRPNTNLEQISDWLTKIIVGLGLVELKSMPTHLRTAARWVAESLSATATPSQAAVSFAGSVIIYFSILGFLAGYLLTLLFLAGALGRAGQQAYGEPAFGDDDLSVKIRDFWRPGGGPPDPTNMEKLAQWIKKNLPEGTSISDLITLEKLGESRKKAVAEIPIR